jgi:predicted ATPase
MEIDITLKNYRCFSDVKPAHISLRKGFTGFVGVNNSGKSSLLKFFYEFRRLFQMLSSPTGNLINALQGRFESVSFPRSIVDPQEIFCNSNNRDLQMEISFTAINRATKEGRLPVPDQLILKIPRGTNTWVAELHLEDGPLKPTGGPVNPLGFSETILMFNNRPKAQLSHLFQLFKALTETLYIGAFRNAINVGTNESYFDIQAGQAFVQAWRTYKTGPLKKHNEAAYNLTEDIKHIFEFEDLEINPSEDAQTLQVFINGKSYRLSELGSGLTQFILVLANAATKQPSYILIDEPELNLHPQLQLDFLTTIGSYAREGVLFATHSIGLARGVCDQIYSVHMHAKGESEVSKLESTPRLSEFLGELSFSGYRELGFNKVLLVEGISDVKTIQQFLRMYKIDHQVVLLSLGGSQLINGLREPELEETKRISDNVFALIDSERDTADDPLEAGRAAFVEACEKAKINCYVLDRRAIENYLSDKAVKKVKGDKYRALQPYEKLKDSSPAWGKEENWRIAREMTKDELIATDLGKFLGSLCNVT